MRRVTVGRPRRRARRSSDDVTAPIDVPSDAELLAEARALDEVELAKLYADLDLDDGGGDE